MLDKTTIYDYIIEMPLTPAFEDNINAMLLMINTDGGSGPSLVVTSDDADNQSQEHGPTVGTVSDSGKQLFSFRLLERLEEAALLTYLKSPMINPMPPITVIGIYSSFPIIEGGTPEEPTLDYETIEAVVRTQVMQYFRIQDYDENGDPDGPPHPPQAGDVLHFSKYAGGFSIVV